MAGALSKAQAAELRRRIMTVIVPNMKVAPDGWIHGLNAEIARICKIPTSSVSGQLAYLVKKGDLERRGAKSQFYRLPKPTKETGRDKMIKRGTHNLARYNVLVRLVIRLAKSGSLDSLIQARQEQVATEIKEAKAQMETLKAKLAELESESELLDSAL